MASLLPDTLFEARGQAPAPSKDFYQVVVTRKDSTEQQCILALKLYINLKPEMQAQISVSIFYTCFQGILRQWQNGDTGSTTRQAKDAILTTLTHMVIFRWWKISLRSEFRETKPGELRESHEDFLDDPSLQIQIAIVFGGSTLEHIFNLCRGNFDFLVRLPDALLLYIVSYLDLEDIARLSQVSHKFETLCNSDKLWEMIVQNLTGKITPEMSSLANEVGWKQFFFTNKLQLQLQLHRRRERKHEPELDADELSD